MPPLPSLLPSLILGAQPGDVAIPLPTRSGLGGAKKGAIGRPASTIANTFGSVVGSSAHAALSKRIVDDSEYVESTSVGQALSVGIVGADALIPSVGQVLFVRVRLRARSAGAGTATLRVEPLTALANNDDATVSRTTFVTPGAPGDYQILFAAQELVSGSYAPWTIDDLGRLAVHLVVEGSYNVRVFSVQAEAFYLPVATQATVFDTTDLLSIGWFSLGTLGAEELVHGVARLNDTGPGFYQVRRAFPRYLDGIGDAVSQLEVVGSWAKDGVYAFTLLAVNVESQYFWVAALESGGVRKIGILKGDPAAYDPTQLSSYQVTANFEWQVAGLHLTTILAWDATTISVFMQDQASPLLTAARSAIGAGPSGGFVGFGTGESGITVSSHGELRALSCMQRGLQQADSDQVVLDYQQREEMSTADGFESTRLLWHAGVAFDRYKIRFGGGAQDDGFFISSANGSTNTEGSGLVLAGAVVESLVAIRDLLPNDRDPDGARALRIYVRNAATGVWTTLITGALEVPIKIFRRPPEVAAADFIEGSGTLSLSADREFRIEPEDSSIPGGSSQAADLSFLDLSGLALTAEPIFEPHQDSFPGLPTIIPLTPPPEVPLNQDGTATLRFRVYDAYGLSELRLLNMMVRATSPFDGTACDAGFRQAFPPLTLEKGGELDPWLQIWDRIECRWRHIVESMQDLIDVRTAPDVALPFKFQEAGLTYPNVPGYPKAALVRLLLRAREINGRRYSLPGLKFYLETLIPGAVHVDVGGFLGGAFMFCDSGDLGLPTLDQINSSGTANDRCSYLAGPLQANTITITITGSVSLPMQEFVRATIRNEILMADDPVSPRPIDVVFVP